MYNVIVSGFKTKEQAEEFIHWYEGQGEQTSAIWFEERKLEGKLDACFMTVDLAKTFPITWKELTAEMVLVVK